MTGDFMLPEFFSTVDQSSVLIFLFFFSKGPGNSSDYAAKADE